MRLWGKRSGRGRRDGDVFRRSLEERRRTEDDAPWFLADDGGEELDIDAGRSARMGEQPPGHEDPPTG